MNKQSITERLQGEARESSFTYQMTPDPNSEAVIYRAEELDILIAHTVQESMYEAMNLIEDCRQEHNLARHGEDYETAYDRAIDCINPKLQDIGHVKELSE